MRQGQINTYRLNWMLGRVCFRSDPQPWPASRLSHHTRYYTRELLYKNKQKRGKEDKKWIQIIFFFLNATCRYVDFLFALCLFLLDPVSRNYLSTGTPVAPSPRGFGAWARPRKRLNPRWGFIHYAKEGKDWKQGGSGTESVPRGLCKESCTVFSMKPSRPSGSVGFTQLHDFIKKICEVHYSLYI